MKNYFRLIAVIILILGASLAASAQCTGIFAAGQICGNPSSTTAGTAKGTSSPIINTQISVPKILMPGSSSGVVTVQPQAAAGTFNFNLPITAGTSRQPLLSGGGGASPMTYSAFSLPNSTGAALQTLGSDGAGSSSWINTTTFSDITVNASCNYQAVGDAAMGSGSSTLTSAAGLFVIGDIGKYIAVQGAGAAGVNLFTTISGFTNSTTVTLTSGNASGGAISGKFAEFGTDDTTALNASIVAAYALKRSGFIPANKSCLVSRLNLTGMQGFTLAGAGANQSFLFAKNDASYGTASGQLIDLTGSLYVTIRDLQVGAFYALPRPTTGVFMAQIASGVSNRITLGPNFYVSGQFSDTTVYNYGVPSSTCFNGDFYNYASGAGTQNVMRMATTNVSSLTSPYATVSGATFSTSDWHFFNCEWHKFTGAGGNNEIIALTATTNLAFNGGVVSGGATQYVTLSGAASNVSFNNVTFETESEPVTPTNVFSLANGATVAGIEWPQSSYIKGGNLIGVTGTGTITTFKRNTPYFANSAGALNPAIALTYFFGTGVNDTVSAANAYSVSAGPSVFANMQCRSSASAGGGFTYTETHQLGGADTALTCAMANPATTCSDTAHVAETTAANVGINFKHVASNVAANTTRMACSVEMQPY